MIKHILVMAKKQCILCHLKLGTEVLKVHEKMIGEGMHTFDLPPPHD